jgi:hypothetical protein
MDTKKTKRTVRFCVKMAKDIDDMIPLVRVAICRRTGQVPTITDVIEEAIRCLAKREKVPTPKEKSQ